MSTQYSSAPLGSAQRSADLYSAATNMLSSSKANTSGGGGSRNVADDPFTFDTPAYHALVGPTTPTLTAGEKTNVENTISGFRDFASSPTVDSSGGIYALIDNYQKQIKNLNQKVTDTSNHYYNQQQDGAKAMSAAEKALAARQQGAPGATARNDGTPLGDDLDYVQSQLIQTNNDLTEMYKAQITAMDKFSITLDDQHRQMVRGIQDTYEQRRQQQIQENNATLGGLGVAGIRSGRTRYATEMQDMMISEQERANISKLMEIDTEERKAILEANTAFNENNFELFIKKMQTIEAAQKSKSQLVQQLYENSMNYEKILMDQRQERRMQEQQEFNQTLDKAKLFAPTILNQMTGNKKEDEAMLVAKAAEMGVDVEFLRGAVQASVYEERQAQIERNFRAASASKSSNVRTLSLQDTISLGLPPSMTGMTEGDVAADFTSPIAPTWFVQEIMVNSGKTDIDATDPTVMNLWQDYRDEQKASFGSEFGRGYTADSFLYQDQSQQPEPQQEEKKDSWWSNLWNRSDKSTTTQGKSYNDLFKDKQGNTISF